MATGPRDTSSLIMLTGWDATELQNHKLIDGTTYAEVARRLAAAVGALQAEFASDWYTNLYSMSDEPEISYRVGVSNGMTQHLEYSRPDAARADQEGHMAPLIGWDRMLGWTWDYLKEARMSQVMADIADAVKDVRDRRRIRLLRRLIRRDDDSGAVAGLGSSGYSCGFATAAASTAVDFTPPANAGTTFDSNHEHFVAIAGGAITAAVLNDVYDELREHGHEAPFDFIHGPDDTATIKALTDYTERGSDIVRLGTTQDVALVEPEYHGVFDGKIRLREVRGMPQYYGAGYKTYGRLSQRNPLMVRLAKGEAIWRITIMTDPRAGSGIVPLQNVMLYMQMGVTVRDRTNGTGRYWNNATWANGTAT